MAVPGPSNMSRSDVSAWRTSLAFSRQVQSALELGSSRGSGGWLETPSLLPGQVGHQ